MKGKMSKEKIKHGPTPWSVDRITRTRVQDSNYCTACHAGTMRENNREALEANAEFIVLAVNSYAALLESCKAILTRLEDDNLTLDAAVADEKVYQQIRAAIALAEKEGA